jgi:hypothetical protein
MSIGPDRRNIGVVTSKYGNNGNNVILDTYCEGVYTNENIDLQWILGVSFAPSAFQLVLQSMLRGDFFSVHYISIFCI